MYISDLIESRHNFSKIAIRRDQSISPVTLIRRCHCPFRASQTGRRHRRAQKRWTMARRDHRAARASQPAMQMAEKSKMTHDLIFSTNIGTFS